MGRDYAFILSSAAMRPTVCAHFGQARMLHRI
jgi:hypothetical protein